MTRRAKAWAAPLRDRLAEERGLTLVETVVAALVLVISTLGVLQVVDAASRNTFRAEQSQVVVNRLQAELEDVRQVTYDEVALTELPAGSADPDSPASRVAGTTFDLSRDGGEPAPLVYQGSPLEEGGQVGDTIPAAVEPGPEPFESGDVSGQIHRYVTWIEDEACGESCPGSQDLKRVVVAATLDTTASGGTRAYQELQTDIVDPDTEPVDNPLPPGEENEALPMTFWLTDTPCDVDERAPTTADHPTHNTHGVCDDGVQLGETSGAPDLLFTEQPPEESQDPENPDPLYDYSNDFGEAPGLRMSPPDSPGCLLPSQLAANEEIDKQAKFHAWLSRPMPGEYELALTGDATLELATRRVEGTLPHKGRICVWLFKRHLNGQGAAIDTFSVNGEPPLSGEAYYHGHPEPPSADWPEQWTEISVPMSFSPFAIAEGERLGLAIAVEREGSQEQELELMYDHPSPNFLSRLEVKTTSDLEPLLGN